MESIVFLGIQGSGKGTQAVLLSKRLNFQHVNIGDLFRMHISQQTEVGKQVKSIIDAGELVSDDIVFDLINRSVCNSCTGIIFDGFPRNIVQAEHLVKNYNLSAVIYLDLDEETATKRMSARRFCPNCKANYNLISKAPKQEGLCDECYTELVQRDDDTPEAIHQRFKEFYSQTLPLTTYFEERGILHNVDASGSVQAIAIEIAKALNLI